MQVRVVNGQARPGTLDDFIKLFKKQLALQGARQDEGFKASPFSSIGLGEGAGSCVLRFRGISQRKPARFAERAARDGEVLAGSPQAETWEWLSRLDLTGNPWQPALA